MPVLLAAYLIAVVALCLALPVYLKVRHRRWAHDCLVAYELRFPSNLDVESVVGVLAGLSGWTPSRWRRWYATPSVDFETAATFRGITQRVLVADNRCTQFERLLVAHVPGVRYARLPHVESIDLRVASTYRLSSGQRPMRIDPVAQVRTLLAGLQPLGSNETITIQWIVTPNGPVQPARAVQVGTSNRLPGMTPTAETTAALKAKQSHPQLLSVLRVGASAGSDDRARSLIRRVEAALHLSNAPGVHLHRRSIPSRLVASHMSQRSVPLVEWPIITNVVESVGILSWPVGIDFLPGLSLGGCRYLPPNAIIPTVGTVLGDANTHGVTRPVALDLEGRYRHQLIVGPTGTGKSTLMVNAALSDVEQGRAVLVIDPKGDVVEDLLARIPQRRTADVVILDASDTERPVGINALRVTGVPPELAAEQLVGVMHRIFSASWGVRTDDLLRAALRTIVCDPDGSLVDVGPLLIDPQFRATMTANVSDPTLVGFWRAFENLSAGEQSQHTAPVLNKWRAIIGRPGLRRALGNPHPSFDLANALNHQAIVLVPLPAGLLGEDAASLFGAVILNLLWNLIQGRASAPASGRQPLMVYLDEFFRFMALPVPLEEMLAQARSYKVGITLATQHLSQLPTDVRHSVLANPRSRLAFQVAHADAQILAREFGSGLTAEDLQGLDAFEAVAQFHAAGRTQAPCTLTARAPSKALRDPAVLREVSRQRWGSDGYAVDDAIRDRMTQPSGAHERKTPGRRPRGDL